MNNIQTSGLDWDDVIEFKCTVESKDIRNVEVKICQWNQETKRWEYLEATRFVPQDEMKRIMEFAQEKRKKHFWYEGKRMRLW